MAPSIVSEIESCIFSLIASILALGIAYRRGFFSLTGQRPANPPTLLLVFIAFAIYFTVAFAIPRLVEAVPFSMDRVDKLSLITFLTSGSLFGALFLFFRAIYQPIRESIWRKPEWKNDALFAIAACLISFPLVLFTGQLLELGIYAVFHTLELPDQLAILFLKMTFGRPVAFLFAALSIVLLAPLVEELLFRGFLQSYLRRYLSAPLAILLSSACFAAFHFSPDQGLGNIPILGSLFILAYFLGFVYERRGSLTAPMIFHAAFNAVSTANLYFFGG